MDIKDKYHIYVCYADEKKENIERLVFSYPNKQQALTKLEEVRTIEKELLQGATFKLVEIETGRYATCAEGMSPYYENRKTIK